MNQRRRRFLRTILLGVGTGLAGCTAFDDDEETPNATERRTTTTTHRSTVGGTTPTTTHEPTTEANEPSTSPIPHPTTGESDTTTPGTDGRATHTVGMFTGLYFDPVGLYIEPGETISFEDVSGSHSATAFHPGIETYSIDPKRRVPKDAPPWNTGVIYEPGESKTITLETKGTYDYFCIPHVELGMIGRIVVGEPGGPATETPNPYANYYPLPDSERIVTEKTVPFDAVAPD